MHLAWLKPLIGRPGPYATVSLSTASERSVVGDVLSRWQILAKSLRSGGTPESVITMIDESIRRAPHSSRGDGRIIVADPDRILVDRVTPRPPERDEAVWAEVPMLIPAIRAADGDVSSLVVLADRSGADLAWPEEGPDGSYAGAQVTGEHDVVARGRLRGHTRAKMLARAEDSWERNAETVAREIDRLVAEQRPEAVLLGGDVRAIALIRERLGKQAAGIVRELRGVSRHDGLGSPAVSEAVDVSLGQVCQARRAAVAGRLAAALKSDSDAVEGLKDVADVLTRGQAGEVVIASASLPALSRTDLWIGDGPTQIAFTAELLPAGTAKPRTLRADVALVRAATAQDAGLTLLDGEDLSLRDGVGALLRWRDRATPSGHVLERSGDSAFVR